MKEELRELVGALSKVYITHRKCFLQQSQKHGLYVGQPQVLNFVIRHPGCTQNEIAAALGVSAASIAFSTKRLQNAGFLQKQVNSLNMRCNKLYVTPEGKEILKEFGSGYDELNQAMFEGFSEDEIKQLADFAKRVDSNLEKFMKEEKSS
ncbi:MAG: winged helix-turn-helix transcriptional regulator [Anaerolineaceae bacterium]|nr:winged helix-turn-helix transcriptional regulator [Anaerolineaceae bacterium]